MNKQKRKNWAQGGLEKAAHAQHIPQFKEAD
jgi:hypothetical protein